MDTPYKIWTAAELKRLLEKHKMNFKAAAEAAGISQQALYKAIRKHYRICRTLEAK